MDYNSTIINHLVFKSIYSVHYRVYTDWVNTFTFNISDRRGGDYIKSDRKLVSDIVWSWYCYINNKLD